MGKPLPAAQRLTRDQWLEQALKVIADTGALRIQPLVEGLGVTKGSFYWHFRDRSEFIRMLIKYWDDHYTQNVIQHMDGLEGSPEDRLLALMEFIDAAGAASQDLAVRAWAGHEPEAQTLVEKVDKVRLDYLRYLFAAMGFEGDELEMRTELFVVFQSMEAAVSRKRSAAQRKRLIKLRHRLLTRK